VATAAEWRAFEQFQLVPVARLQQLEVGLVVTVETIVVPVVRAMGHHQIVVLLREDDPLLCVIFQDDLLFVVMAGVAIETRRVAAGSHQFSTGHPDSARIGECRIHRRDRRTVGRATPNLEVKCGRQEGKHHAQQSEHNGAAARGIHGIRGGGSSDGRRRMTPKWIMPAGRKMVSGSPRPTPAKRRPTSVLRLSPLGWSWAFIGASLTVMAATEAYEQSLSRWLFVGPQAAFGFTFLAENFVLFGIGGADYSRMPLFGVSQRRAVKGRRCQL
jgi:hypothetical protein